MIERWNQYYYEHLNSTEAQDNEDDDYVSTADSANQSAPTIREVRRQFRWQGWCWNCLYLDGPREDARMPTLV